MDCDQATTIGSSPRLMFRRSSNTVRVISPGHSVSLKIFMVKLKEGDF